MSTLRTRVGVVGAGPAGLIIAIALRRAGVDCLVVERRTRQRVESHARAGFIEARVADYLRQQGLAERMDREAVPHTVCEFRRPGRRFHFEYGRLAGDSAHTVYPQQLLVRDLIGVFLAEGGTILFEHEVVGISGLEDAPRLRCRTEAGPVEIDCRLLAGCEGSRGGTRGFAPDGALPSSVKRYPLNWLGILAEVPPPAEDEVVYAMHPRGFAGHMPRTRTVSRLYLQTPPQDTVADWPPERIWEELRVRLAAGGAAPPEPGAIMESEMVGLRLEVAHTMQYGRLFLAGDSAHVLSPVGAKGMNLAIGDAVALSGALIRHCRGDEAPLKGYSDARLPQVWRAVQFTDAMLHMIHPPTEAQSRHDAEIERRLYAASLERLEHSPSAARAFAHEYVGNPERD